MRIVLDTNVLVSALIAGEGPPGRLLAAVKRGDCTLVTSDYQIEELRRVLDRDRLKPYIRPVEARDLLQSLESVSVVVTELPDVDLSPDPKDNSILFAVGRISGAGNITSQFDRRPCHWIGFGSGRPLSLAFSGKDVQHFKFFARIAEWNLYAFGSIIV